MNHRIPLVAALVCLACANPLSALGPYPCAADATCPEGLACIGGTCTTPQLGALCSADTRCDEAASAATCSAFGVCATGCTDGAGCGAGLVCSQPSGAGACLTDCTAGGACLDGLQCDPLWVRGEKACMQPDVQVTACTRFVTQSQCNFCQDPANWSVACSGGATCPRWSSCTGNGTTCTCWSWTTAVHCDGTPCSSTSPCTTSWWCKPNSAIGTSCGDSPIPAAGACDCRDGRQIAMDCGYTQSCEERCSVGCDVARQDCTDLANAKCSIVSNGTTLVAHCVPLTGSVALAQPCTRTAEDSSGVGHDDCSQGLFCSGVSLQTGRACRALCTKAADCPTGLSCVAIAVGARPGAGMCLPSCTVFASCGGGAGQTCTPTYAADAPWTTYCRSTGTGAIGTGCTRAEDCAANGICWRPPTTGLLTCEAVCDASHACPGGQTCHAIPSLPNGVGICW